MNKNNFLSLIYTILLLIVMEIVSSTLLPLIGIIAFRPEINILFVLYLSFRLSDSLLPIYIFILQYIHSAFTIEGWEVGTIIGVLVSLMVRQLKDLIHLTSVMMTMLTTFIFIIVWILAGSFIIYMKTGKTSSEFSHLSFFFWEAFLLTLVAPSVYKILGQFWKKADEGNIKGVA